jgi:hypothetical protein
MKTLSKSNKKGINKFAIYTDDYKTQLTDYKYDVVDSLTDKLVKVKINGKYGVVNDQGEEICEIKYDEIGYFNHGFAIVNINGKLGFINDDVKEICEIIYNNISLMLDDWAYVEINYKCGVMYKDGTIIVPCKYISYFDIDINMIEKEIIKLKRKEKLINLNF